MSPESDPLFVSARAVMEATAEVGAKVTDILGGRKSDGHTAVLRQPGRQWQDMTGDLTEWDWRVIQFALIRAGESI
jgi:hypothetical protein